MRLVQLAGRGLAADELRLHACAYQPATLRVSDKEAGARAAACLVSPRRTTKEVPWAPVSFGACAMIPREGRRASYLGLHTAWAAIPPGQWYPLSPPPPQQHMFPHARLGHLFPVEAEALATALEVQSSGANPTGWAHD